jgi:Integrase zinc binding domain/Integrase core domain
MVDFTVLHAAGDGEPMAVSDALSRDFVDGQVRCNRCLEVMAKVDDEQAVESEVEAMRCTQETEFGNDLGKCARERGYLVSDEKLLCRMRKDHVQVFVPKAMVERVLQRVQGSRSVGHWGISRTALAVARQYWWPKWLADVEAHIERCLPCAMARMGRSGKRNAKMIRYTPTRRFDLVALEITELSPQGKNRERKADVIGDVKSRSTVAVPTANETATTLTDILWMRWIPVFGPPEHLLTDLGKPLVSDNMRNLCARAGVAKIFTSAYHPQCNGMVERFNRTMAADLAKTILCEESWL